MNVKLILVGGLITAMACPLQGALLFAPMRAGEFTSVITAPEGRVQECATTGDGFYMFMSHQFSYYGDTVASKLVYGDEGEVYFYNILPYGATNTYVKGQIVDEKVVIELPQTVAWSEKDQYGINLDILRYYEEEDKYTYRPDEIRQSVTFYIGEDDSLTMEDLGEGCQLGYVYSDDDAYLGYGATALHIQHFYDKVVEIPDTADIQDWSIIDNDWGTKVKVAFNGEDVYIKGLLYTYYPDVWIKGYMVKEEDRTTIRLPGYQYMGMDSNVFTYLAFAVEGETDPSGYTEMILLDAEYEYVLDYDLEKKRISGDNPKIEIVATGDKDLYYPMDSVRDPVIQYQDSYAGIPADPYDLTYLPTDFHQNGFIFYVPSISTENTVLDSEYLSYIIYMDGEVFEFDSNEYDLDSDMIEVPYNFDNESIQNYGGTCRWIWLSVENISKLGVQSVYRYDKVETRSNIVSISLETSSDMAIDDNMIVSETYFDITGHKVSSPAIGVYIRKRIFANGTIITDKVGVTTR